MPVLASEILKKVTKYYSPRRISPIGPRGFRKAGQPGFNRSAPRRFPPPRSTPTVDFGKRLELDEPAHLRLVKATVFFSLPVSNVPLLHRLAEVLAVVADVKFVVFDGAVFDVVLAWQIGETLDGGRRGEFNDDFVRTFRAWRPATACARIVFGSPSTAFAPLPSSPAVSSLSTLTTLSAIFAGATDGVVDVAGVAGGVGDVAGAGVAAGVQQAVLSVWQPLVSSTHTASADAPATREFNLVFIISS